MKGSKLFIIAGSALALLAVVVGIASMSGGGGTEAKDEQKVTVVEATTDIPAYSILKQEDLIEKQVNQADAPADAVSMLGEPDARSDSRLRVAFGDERWTGMCGRSTTRG